MIQKLRSNQKGFTLIELMIVIAIIGILAAIAIPQFNAYRIRSRRTKSMTLQGVSRSAEGAMNLDVGGFGSTANGAYGTDGGQAGVLLDSSLAPIAGATDLIAGAQVSAPAGGGIIAAVGVDVPQGCVYQVMKDVAGVGQTYTAYSFAYSTDRVFATDFEFQSNVMFVEDPTWRAFPLSSNAFPGGTPAIAATTGNDVGAFQIAGK